MTSVNEDYANAIDDAIKHLQSMKRNFTCGNNTGFILDKSKYQRSMKQAQKIQDYCDRMEP